MNSPETENKQKAIGDLKKTLQIVSYRLKQYRRKYRVQTVVSVFLLLALVTSLMQDLYTQAAPPAASYSEVSSDADWNLGTLDDVSVSSGSIEISGDGGPGWLSGWQNRQPVTITNGGSAQTEYQVRMEIAYDAKMQTDFDDLRFAKADGTELDFWLRSKVDSTSADVWVEVDSLAGSGDTVIYMYYNNSGATSASDGAATFPLFDNFDDGSLDTGKWTEADPRSHIAEASGTLQFLNGSGAGGWDTSVYSVSSFTRDDWAFEWEQSWISDYSPYDAFMFGWKDNGSGGSYTNLVYGYYNSGSGTCTTNCVGNVYEDGSSRGNAGVWSKDVNYDVRVRMRSTGGAYYEKSTDSGDSWTSDYTSTYSTEATLHPAWMLYAGDHLVDNARVRKWMTTEPSIAFGTEESALQSPGTYTSHNLDLQYIYKWGDCASGCNDASTAFTTNITVPANTSAKFEIRHSADGSTNWSSWTTIETYTTSGAKTKTRGEMVTLIGDIFNRYVQTRITLSSSDGSNNPSVADYRYDYTIETDPPSNPDDQNGYAENGGTAITSGNWYNHPAPYFTWSGAADTDSGISGGYSGYWVCFGASDCEPTDGTFVTSAAYTASSLITNTTYYLRIKARDAVGNVAATSYDAFEYKYDVTNPDSPGVAAADPAGYTNVNDFTFLWSAGDDDQSGVAGYLYKTGEEGATEAFTADTSVSNIEAYQDSVNTFYVRTQDMAGNFASTYAQVNYYYNGSAPSEPTDLAVDPEESTINSFTFSWDLPEAYTGSISRYHYSINSQPTEANTTVTTAQSVGPGAFATQQGVNTFYVVAEDAAGNVNYNAYASVEFTADTTAPGIPTGLTITDSSIRSQEKYSLTLTWDAPANEGSGIDHYAIERSVTAGCADGTGTWTAHATTTAEGYFDPNLSNATTYCYRVKSSDNAGAESPSSSIVSLLPEGRFTDPPGLIGNPGVTARIQSAVIEWLTDREGNSFVQYGLTDEYGFETGQDDFLTSHSVTILDLEPATVYHYRVKYTDQDGNTGYSADATFTTADAPSAPTNLTVSPTANTQNIFAFDWGPPADEGVEIQGYFYSLNDTPNAGNTSFTADSDLPAGPYASRQGTNIFYVVAIDSVNNVNYANYASVQFEAETPAPPIPTGLIITDASNRETADYSIAIKWKAIPAASAEDGDVQYKVYRSTHNDDFRNVATIATTGYLDVDLDNTTEYSYYITAEDSAGSTSAPSSQVSQVPEGRFTTPPAITVAPVVIPGSFSATIKWGTERETLGFVEYGLTSDAIDQSHGEDEHRDEHAVLVEGLEPETLYYYRVKNIDVDGNISYSAVSTFTTLEAPRVSNVQINDIRLFDALITWDTNVELTTALEYGPTTNYGFTIADVSNSRTTSHTVKLENLTDGTLYHLRLRGTDAEGNTLSSDDYTFTTLTFPRVDDVTFQNKAEGETEVTWTTNVPTTSEVEYGNTDIPTKTQGNTAFVTEHSILLFGLEDATAYDVRIRGRDQFGYEALSDTVSFTTLEDTTPPIISNVLSESNTVGSGESSKIQIIVSWETNEPTSSQIEFGQGLSSDAFTDTTDVNNELVNDHLMVVSDLDPARTYHFRVVSSDKAQNQSVSDSYSVLTARKRESFLQIVIANLEDTFAWMGNIGDVFR